MLTMEAKPTQIDHQVYQQGQIEETRIKKPKRSAQRFSSEVFFGKR
jgi:hypothetical protein